MMSKYCYARSQSTDQVKVKVLQCQKTKIKGLLLKFGYKDYQKILEDQLYQELVFLYVKYCKPTQGYPCAYKRTPRMSLDYVQFTSSLSDQKVLEFSKSIIVKADLLVIYKVIILLTCFSKFRVLSKSISLFQSNLEIT